MTIFDFFNEAEYLVKQDLKEPEITEVVVSSYRRSNKTKGKLEVDLEGLPARIIDQRLSEEELSALFPQGYEELPEEIYKHLHIIPETFIVDKHHVPAYASRRTPASLGKLPVQLTCYRTASQRRRLSRPS